MSLDFTVLLFDNSRNLVVPNFVASTIGIREVAANTYLFPYSRTIGAARLNVQPFAFFLLLI